MKQLFPEFIEKHKLCKPGQKILAAVSGGIDSVVMFHLLNECGFDTAIAHCNFQLRGEESNKEELFVKKLAEKYGVAIFTTRFDTSQTAAKQHISIQMTARNLRYNWFEKIRLENGYQRIAIAHNKNDAIETFFINLSRGTGLKGLTGIRVKAGAIIRPLLFATREEIKNYQQKHNLFFCEDSSNLSVKYKRNKIRHEIIPLFKEINPSFVQTMNENLERLSDAEALYKSQMNDEINKLLSENKNGLLIDIENLKKHPQKKALLFEILEPYGFSGKTTDEILQTLDSEPGKQFFSSSHRLVKDRKKLIMGKKNIKEKKSLLLDDETEEITNPVHLCFKTMQNPGLKNISKNKNIAHIDAALVAYPLILRRWEKGDKFMPLGMQHYKKLSDFFTDEKFSLPEKENTWLLCSNTGEIIWAVGHRLDERYKISPETKRMIKITLL